MVKTSLEQIRLFLLVLSALSLCDLDWIHAAPGNSGITYQGRIIKPDGTPLEGANVQFRLQIRTPDSGNCLMYEELQAQDLRNSKGQFSLTINDGTGSRQDLTGLTLDRIFANVGSFTLDAATCTTGTGAFAPNSGDGRKLAVSFKDETMAAWEPMPPQNINYVPLAFESKQVQGFNASQLLRVVESDGVTPTLTPLSPLSNGEYQKLKDLAAGNFGTGAIDSTAIVNGTIVGADLSSSIAITTSGAITSTGSISSAASSTRNFQLFPPSGTNGITFAAPAGVSNYTITYPPSQGSAGQTLVNDGSGNLSWAYLGATYTSPGSSGTNGLWFRMATATVTAQYGWTSTIIDYHSGGTYNVNPVSGRIVFSLKMQDPPGGATAISVNVDSVSSALRPDDVRAVVVSNSTGGSVVTELWVRMHNEWNTITYRPVEVASSSGSLAFTPSAALQASPPAGIQTIQSRSGLSPFYRVGSRNETGYGSQRHVAFTEGNVGIGTETPASKLEVSGTMVSTPSTVATGATVDLALSNTTILNSVGGSSIALSNLRHGGNYTIVVKDATSRTYDFTGCASKRWIPAPGPTTSSSWSLYTILALDNGAGAHDCMITWATGYQ